MRLLERVSAVEGIERIRFTSPHPLGFRQDLVQEAYDWPGCPSSAIMCTPPMQSGSNRVLRAMNRPYTRERLPHGDRRGAAGRCAPQMYFSTDVIVGFPGETEADFNETRSLFEAVNYDMAYIFKYSVRSGTRRPAAMEGQVPAEVRGGAQPRPPSISSRKTPLRRRNQARSSAPCLDVLVEGQDRTGRGFIGRTSGNRVEIFAADPRRVGAIVPLKVRRTTVSTLYGELVVAGVAAVA